MQVNGTEKGEDPSLNSHSVTTFKSLESQSHNVENPRAANSLRGTSSSPYHEKDPQSGSDSGVSIDSIEENKDDFPEGGLRAWAVVAGSFCGLFSVFGIINSTGVILQYLSANQLKDYSPSQVGWIFGLSLFLTFFCGAPIGPIFDAYGPKALVFCGSILLVISMMLLGLCTSRFSSRQHLTELT